MSPYIDLVHVPSLVERIVHMAIRKKAVGKERKQDKFG